MRLDIYLYENLGLIIFVKLYPHLVRIQWLSTKTS